MSASISLAAPRNTLLDYYRCPYHQPELRLRAHILLLLADGYAWATIAAVLYCSTRTIARWKRSRSSRRRPRRCSARPQAPAGDPLGRPGRQLGHRADAAGLRLVPQPLVLRGRRPAAVADAPPRGQPRDCPPLAAPSRPRLARRPRPVLSRTDPDRDATLGKLRALLRDLPDDETAVFQDEADLSLNPEVGCMWMAKGRQSAAADARRQRSATWPGRCTGGRGPCSRRWGPSGTGRLFARHLDELRHRLRRYKKIHVICDNAKFHKHGGGAVPEGARGSGGVALCPVTRRSATRSSGWWRCGKPSPATTAARAWGNWWTWSSAGWRNESVSRQIPSMKQLKRRDPLSLLVAAI